MRKIRCNPTVQWRYDDTESSFRLLDMWRKLSKYMDTRKFPYVNLSRFSFGTVIFPKYEKVELKILIDVVCCAIYDRDEYESGVMSPIPADPISVRDETLWTRRKTSLGTVGVVTLDFNRILTTFMETGEVPYVVIRRGSNQGPEPFYRACFHVGKIVWEDISMVPMTFEMSEFRMPENDRLDIFMDIIMNKTLSQKDGHERTNGFCPISLFRIYGEMYIRSVKMRMPYITSNKVLRTIPIGYESSYEAMLFIKDGYAIKDIFGNILKPYKNYKSLNGRYPKTYTLTHYNFRRMCTKRLKYTVYNENDPSEAYDMFSTEAVNGGPVFPVMMLCYYARCSSESKIGSIYFLFGI